MKTCPQCQTRYTDDTLRFCLQDGATLTDVAQSDTPTVSFSGAESNAPADQPNEAISQETRWRKSEVTSEAARKGKRKSSAAPVVAAIVLILLFLIAGGTGLGLWLYFQDSNDDGGGNNSANRNSPIPTATPAPSLSPTMKTPVPTPSVSPTAAPTPATPTPTPAGPDLGTARREVEQKIFAWKADIEAMDINRLMSHYAGTVDYYLRRGVDRNFVRADKMRAFNRFVSIGIAISSVKITVDDAGESATALFDKAWVFEGTRRSSGMVQSQLKMRKIGGVWFITGERDLRVYRRN